MGDQRGAIMLAGLHFAILLTAVMYYVAGIGAAIEHREAMQDTVDVAVFAAAVVHARGMNLLALINLVMMGLLATLVALKLIETLCTIALVAILALVVWIPALGSAIEPIRSARSAARKTHDAMERPVMGALRGLHTAADAVRVAVPAVAQVGVMASVVRRQGPPARGAFTLPSALTLPVEPAPFEDLCREAERFVAELVLAPLTPLLPDKIESTIEGAIADLAGAGSGWYCGDGDGKPPTTTLRYDVVYPRLPEVTQCASPNEPDCRDLEVTLAQMEVDPDTGSCLHNCTPGGPYDRRVRAARKQCDTSGGGWHARTPLRGFAWQERRFQRRTTRGPRGDVVVDGAATTHLVRQARDSERHPCGRGGSVGGGYAREAGRFQDPTPVCVGMRRVSDSVVEVTEVTHIIACQQTIEETRSVEDFSKDPHLAAKGSSAWKSQRAPMRVKDSVSPGAEPLQLRGVALGGLPSTGPLRAIQVARWRFDPDLTHGPQHEPGRTALAQAEYYYDTTLASQRGTHRWLWNPRWRARLRRLRAPAQQSTTDGPGTALSGARSRCTEAMGDDMELCTSSTDWKDLMEGVVLH